MVKNLPAIWRPGFNPWVRTIPWKREWLLTPAFLLGEFHGQIILGVYSPWGQKESGRTEQFSLTHSLKFNLRIPFDTLTSLVLIILQLY